MMSDIYNQFYTLLSNAFFNGVPTAVTYGEFFCEGIAIVACALLLAMPFLFVWRVVKRFL